jgi:hypothetical protein
MQVRAPWIEIGAIGVFVEAEELEFKASVLQSHFRHHAHRASPAPPRSPDVLAASDDQPSLRPRQGSQPMSNPDTGRGSLVFNKFLRKSCKISLCVCLVGLGAPRTRLSPLPLPPSILAGVCSTVSSEKVNEHIIPTSHQSRGIHGTAENAAQVVVVVSWVLVVLLRGRLPPVLDY